MSEEIRLFDSAAVQRHIDEQLAALPEDKHGAVVAYADGNSAKMAVVARLSNGWSMVTSVERDWGGDWDWSTSVRWSW